MMLSGSRPPALRTVTRSLRTLPWTWKLCNTGPHPHQPRPQLWICSLGTFDASCSGVQLQISCFSASYRVQLISPLTVMIKLYQMEESLFLLL